MSDRAVQICAVDRFDAEVVRDSLRQGQIDLHLRAHVCQPPLDVGFRVGRGARSDRVRVVLNARLRID